MFRFGVAPRGGNEIRRRLRESLRASPRTPLCDRIPMHCSLRAGWPSGVPSKAAKCGDFERLRFSSCPNKGKIVRHPIRRAVFSLGRASRSTGGRKGPGEVLAHLPGVSRHSCKLGRSSRVALAQMRPDPTASNALAASPISSREEAENGCFDPQCFNATLSGNSRRRRSKPSTKGGS